MFEKYPLVALPARNGIFSGVLASALLIALYYLGRHPFLIPVILDFRLVLFAVLLVYTLKEYRDYYRKGVMSFWEGMIASFVLTIAFSIVTFAVLWIFGATVPGFVEQYVTLKTLQLQAYPPEAIERIGQPQYQLFLTELPSTRSVDLALVYLRQSYILSFFVSIIISVILRRQPKI